MSVWYWLRAGVDRNHGPRVPPRAHIWYFRFMKYPYNLVPGLCLCSQRPPAWHSVLIMVLGYPHSKADTSPSSVPIKSSLIFYSSSSPWRRWELGVSSLWDNRRIYVGLLLVPDTGLLFNFLGDKSVFCSTEITLGGAPGWLLDWTAVHQIEQAMIWLRNFSSASHSPERGEELEMKLIIGHVHVRKPP